MSEPRPEAENPPVATRAFDEKTSELARTYAEALIGAAAKEGSVDEVLEELTAIRAFCVGAAPSTALSRKVDVPVTRPMASLPIAS